MGCSVGRSPTEVGSAQGWAEGCAHPSVVGTTEKGKDDAGSSSAVAGPSWGRWGWVCMVPSGAPARFLPGPGLGGPIPTCRAPARAGHPGCLWVAEGCEVLRAVAGCGHGERRVPALCVAWVRVLGCSCTPRPSFSIPGAGVRASPGVGGSPEAWSRRGVPVSPRARVCGASPELPCHRSVWEAACGAACIRLRCHGAGGLLGFWTPPFWEGTACGWGCQGVGEAVGGLGVLAGPAQEGDKAPGLIPSACQP